MCYVFRDLRICCGGSLHGRIPPTIIFPLVPNIVVQSITMQSDNTEMSHNHPPIELSSKIVEPASTQSTALLQSNKSGLSSLKPSNSSLLLTSTNTSIIRTDRTEQTQQPIENSSTLELNFDFSVTTGRILDCFASVGTSLGFNLIEEETNHATMVKQKKRSILDLINCLNFGKSDQGVTAVKIHVKTNQSKAVRVAKLRGLVGARDQVKRFLDQFKARSKTLKNNTAPSYFQDQMPNQPQQLSSNPFQVQVCADYAFYKILSLEKYGLGNKLSHDLTDFKLSFKNIQQSTSLIPLPIKNLYTIIGEVVDSLFKEFNSGRKEMEKVMPYCRVSVEKYVCEKLNDTIYPIYSARRAKMEAEFRAKRERILEEWSVKDIYGEVGLVRKNWLVKEGEVGEGYDKVLGIKTIKQNRAIIPYSKAVEEFEKIQSTTNIRQKLKYTQVMYTKVKSMVYDFSSGKQQLTNIEDILPITIILILLTQIKNLRAQLDIMSDFLSFQANQQQSQKRLLTNLTESYNYIWRDWKLD